MNALHFLRAVCVVINGNRINERVFAFKYRFFADLHGTVVEIGPGAGVNLQFFPQTVSSYIGIEPNPVLCRWLKRRKDEYHLPIQAVNAEADKLPYSSESVDAVISTFVLCHIPDQKQVLKEIKRVLKPGGRFLFIEHVASRHYWVRKLQDLISPVSCRLQGCRLNCDTIQSIRESGFASLKMIEGNHDKLFTIAFGTCTK